MPIAFIPNGSGNDTCIQFMSNDVANALEYIVKGDIIKYDVAKVLLDHDDEASIP